MAPTVGTHDFAGTSISKNFFTKFYLKIYKKLTIYTKSNNFITYWYYYILF